jgi:hypothetical protein
MAGLDQAEAFQAMREPQSLKAQGPPAPTTAPAPVTTAMASSELAAG